MTNEQIVSEIRNGESYFGLWEAVQHYETSANVRFMTYAEYWIRQVSTEVS